MTFDVSSMIGSVLLGTLFKKVNKRKKHAVMIPFLVLLIFCFILLKYMQFGVVGYFIMIGCVGFCLGGAYNTMTSLVTMQLVVDIPK